MSYEIYGRFARPEPTIGDKLRRLKSDPGYRIRAFHQAIPGILGFLALLALIALFVDSVVRVVEIIQ